METQAYIYDLTVLLDVEDDSAVGTLIKKYNGTVHEVRPLTKISLAYPIKKQNTAFMVVFIFEMDSNKVVAFKRDLTLEDHVLRHLMLRGTVNTGTVEGEESRKTVRRPSSSAPQESFLSNEALEKKIEEISQ